MSKVTDLYGSMVFNEHVMRERLPKTTYKQLMKTIKEGAPLNEDVANVVAHAMKEWAIEKGATHYTHWFQPLTGITSEKHDSFIDPTDDGCAIMTFSGKELIQGEPDASSFPSGGLRATFEARGYTAWDPTSYAFIKDEVLCIPTAFCSYTGEALDKKTPLLRSMKAIETQGRRVLDLFGDDSSDRITTTLGAEQEYFLISEKDYERRLDIMLTGRTLFGYPPVKGQELEEHYFGAIRPTVNEFMKELDDELWALGISAKTKHNEVAPAIVSMFLGDELGAIVEALIDDHDYTSAERVSMDLGVDVLPNFIKDNTDRNRTSPFAFTGNKFEFRMPGSAQNLSDVNMVLNTAMAKSLKEFADQMEGKTGDEFEAAAIDYIKRTLRDHERIIFNGDGYSEEWEKEAARRGLANHRTTADALPCLVDQKSIDLFTEFGVLTEDEIRSRYEVKLEKYNKIMNIEIRAMKRLVRRDYLPAINRYAAKLANGISAIKNVLPEGDTSFMKDKLEKLVAGAAEINRQLEKLHELHHASREIENQQERANMNAHEIIPVMDALREAVDAMEIIVERDAWPVPTYNEILFYA